MTTSLAPGASPPIVFVAQLGAGGDSWKPVLERLRDVNAFTYDRPGTGVAPPRPAPKAPLPYSVFADELADLLDQHGIAEPAIIVGHSVGSHIARLFAARYPRRLAGFVAVDGSIPQFKLWPDTGPVIDGDPPNGTEIDILTGQVELLTATVPTVPAVVLTRKRRWWSQGFDNIPHPGIDELWIVSQRILARQWNAPLIIAENAGHQIPREAPDLVAYVIGALVRSARTGVSAIFVPERLAELGGRLDGAGTSTAG